ncbi:unnamed protein product [Symbiodinium sp. CCMP2456]|nr:unnamed protein product [Symbiodinium sp. CCMP2456]
MGPGCSGPPLPRSAQCTCTAPGGTWRLVELTSAFGACEPQLAAQRSRAQVPGTHNGAVMRIGNSRDPNTGELNASFTISAQLPRSTGDDSLQVCEYSSASQQPRWHTDATFRCRPPTGSLLYSIEVPPSGGDTCFADAATAFERLPLEARSRLESLEAVCSQAHHDALHNARKPGTYATMEEEQRRQTPLMAVPLVMTHPVTGRKSLYGANSSVFYVQRRGADGPSASLLERAEGAEAYEDPSVDELRKWLPHATGPEFVVRWRWQPGDLVIWDNRSTMHCATGFDHEHCTRQLWRTTFHDMSWDPPVRSNGSLLEEGMLRMGFGSQPSPLMSVHANSISLSLMPKDLQRGFGPLQSQLLFAGLELGGAGRILLCGDVRGDLPKVCKCVDGLQRKLPEEQRFRAVFCVGEFSAEEMNLDVEEKPTVPIYFIDCGPACQDLIDESPQGDEVAPNVHFLGHYGVTSVAGLKVLSRAAQLSREQKLPVLPVYLFDPRQFRETKFGTLKTGAFRALFLLQSVRVLKRRLRSLGSDLLVKVGKPEDVLPSLLDKKSVILTQEEVTSEERSVDKALRRELAAKGCEAWEYCWGSTLFHRDDLPFRQDLSNAPDVFTSFKNQVEPEMAARVNEVPTSFQDKRKDKSHMGVRPCLPDLTPGALPLPEAGAGLDFDMVFEPEWEDLPFEKPVEEPEVPEAAAHQFEGGEIAALGRLQYYLFETDLVANYFETRNGMLGSDYSTKFAPWLAFGCLSPRKIFEQIREYEKEKVANKSTYWVLFELMWRDFFRFFAAKHGNKIFKLYGVSGGDWEWQSDAKLFQLWAHGMTGYPLIDANMRELRATGFMSNRGRQNVASFLALDMKIDWRMGADWFESYLVDYDVASNWGNWVHAAGMTTGRINRFNVIRQSKMYDKDGRYIRHWVPELRSMPVRYIHEPWTLSPDEKLQFGAESRSVAGRLVLAFFCPSCGDAKVIQKFAGVEFVLSGWPCLICSGLDGTSDTAGAKADDQRANLDWICFLTPRVPKEGSWTSTVAYLSGRLKAELFEEQDDNYDEDGGQTLPQADDLKSKYAAQEGDRGLFAGAPLALETEPTSSTATASRSSSGPSWEELKAKEKKKEFMQTQLFLDGRYTPLAVERLCEEIGDSGGVDILLTSEWPKVGDESLHAVLRNSGRSCFLRSIG